MKEQQQPTLSSSQTEGAQLLHQVHPSLLDSTVTQDKAIDPPNLLFRPSAQQDTGKALG